MEIDVIDNREFLNTDLKEVVIRTTQYVLTHLELPGNSEICISFIGDTEMRKLNSDFRSIDRTTDILSFSQDFEHQGHILGDIVISFETAVRHAEKYGITVEKEIKKLIVHGVLHLLGHDHKKKKETEIMRNKESELLNAIESE